MVCEVLICGVDVVVCDAGVVVCEVVVCADVCVVCRVGTSVPVVRSTVFVAEVSGWLPPPAGQ